MKFPVIFFKLKVFFFGCIPHYCVHKRMKKKRNKRTYKNLEQRDLNLSTARKQ